MNEPRPQTRYVTVGDADVAYQVVGEGPRDLLTFNGLGHHIEFAWQLPGVSEFLTRLASMSRLIRFNRRGVGASEGVPRNAIPTWEDFTEDAAAVLDAVGSQQTAIFVSWALSAAVPGVCRRTGRLAMFRAPPGSLHATSR